MKALVNQNILDSNYQIKRNADTLLR
jgi:hypothetical protein